MECYPVAKVGGLADVVGALPKYQNKIEGINARVVMPWYNKKFVHENEFEVIFESYIHQSNSTFQVMVLKEKKSVLGFDLYLIKIPGLLDRDNPYGYRDESYQFIAFQNAVLHWMTATKIRPDVLHCHDYHTGLIPFMVEYCPEFEFLRGVKTIGTIHNGEYQGQMRWEMANYLPWFDGDQRGLLDWEGYINPLATMIKCSHAFNAVSQGYMDELYQNLRGLESLVQQEHAKAYGIINGIDVEVWDPNTDPYLLHHYTIENAGEGKFKNKLAICQEYGLNPVLPLIGFIGRFAGEKGADLLPDIVWKSIQQTYGAINIIILGSGETHTENRLAELSHSFTNFALDLGYKEALSHQIYAGADFLIMPSRVEPCGLNQMYAMRYGTVPIVRYIGGLKDTVGDISTGGAGIVFDNATVDDAVNAIHRALSIYHHPGLMHSLVENNMKFNFSWVKSAENYVNLYQL